MNLIHMADWGEAMTKYSSLSRVALLHATHSEAPIHISRGQPRFTLTILFADDGDGGLRPPRIMLYLNLRTCYPTSYSGGQWNHWFPVMIWWR